MKITRLKIIIGICLLAGSIPSYSDTVFARRVREDKWIPIEALDKRIILNEKTGRLKFNGDIPAVGINFALWIVRHGETEGNIKKVFQGQSDEGINQLTENGRKEASEAAEVLFTQLKDKIIAGGVVVITSKLGRAEETAAAFINLVEHETGIKIVSLEEELANEISHGVWENQTLEQLTPAQHSLALRYRGLDAIVRPEKSVRFIGENFIDLLIRTKELLVELNELYKNKTVVLFGHGTQFGALRALLSDRKLLDGNGWIDWRPTITPKAQPMLFGPTK